MRLLIVILLLTAGYAFSQNPLTKHYSALDYGKSPRNWGITKSGEGLMYVGNNEGLLEFNGTDWRFIEVPGNTVREVVTNDRGDVFVGTLNNFGYLKKNELGLMDYVSISDSLPDESKPQTIWNINCIGDKVYFQTSTKIYIYDSNEQIRILEASNYNWSYGTTHNFYVSKKEKLLRYQNGSLIELSDFGTGFFEKMIFSITDYGDNELLLFSKAHGPTIYSEESQSFRPLDETGQLKEWCNKYRFYGAEKIQLSQNYKDGSTKASIFYVLISSDGGVLITNSEGHIVYRLTTDTGIHSNNMNNIFFDEEQSILWFATYNGILKVNLGYPVDRYNYLQNLTSRIHAIHNHGGDIYVATDNGLFVQNTKTQNFDQIKGTESQCWNMITIGNELLVSGGNNGIYVVKNKSVVNSLYTESALFKLLPASENSLFYLGLTYTGIIVIHKSDNRYVNLGVVPESEGIDFRHLEKDELDHFWAGSSLNGFVKLEIPDNINPKTILEDIKLYTYNTSSGLESIQNCKVFSINDELIFTSKNGIYKFNYDLQKFEVYNPFNLALYEDRFNHISIIQDSENNWWIPESKIVISKKPSSEYSIDYTSLNVIPVPATTIYNDEKNISWIGTDDGLYRYGYYIELPRHPFKSMLSKIKLEEQDSLLFKGSTSKLSLSSKLPYEFNSIAFSFTSNEFIDEEGVTFRFMLEGINDKWSSWTPNRFKDYNDLREGSYTFKVQAKNIFGRVSEVSSFPFTISPPWYRTVIAYLIYFTGGVLLIFLIIKVSIYRLKRAKTKLENIVIERTHVISMKNREITDSINYAKHIQNAMLQSEEKSSEDIPEHFLIFKPKDIVSGDFYLSRYISHNDQKFWYVIVGDCTGHGVPGGFLTMLGVSYLNEMISNDAHLMQPSEILDTLREKVIQDLSQSGQRDQSRDGMDMSIMRINLDTLEASYSGANNPLWVISRIGELKVVPGNKQPVSYIENATPFTNHKLKLEKEDSFYMFSDGFADQFGGVDLFTNKPAGKKYKSANFKKLLLKLHDKPMVEQKEIIDRAFEDWKGDLEQVDDVCIIGVRL